MKLNAPHTFVNTNVNLNNDLKSGKKEHKKIIDGLIVEKVIGTGSYAVVRIAKDEITGIKYAIKTYDKYKLYDVNKRKNVRREINILGLIEHPNIIILYKTIDTPTQVIILMNLV